MGLLLRQGYTLGVPGGLSSMAVYIRNTFVHVIEDAAAESQPPARRTVSDPLTPGAHRGRLGTCMRASQDSDDKEHVSREADPRGERLAGGGDASLPECGASQRRTSRSTVAPEAQWSKGAYRKPADWQGERTTVMLKNLPGNTPREDLVATLKSRGFGEKVDFLYMPFDLETGGALGYAWVNLQTPADAKLMMRSLEGFKWSVPSEKRCSVGWCHPFQGLQALVEKYRNSPLMHEVVPDYCRPLLFKDGERIPFPLPTKPLKPPRRGAQLVRR